MVSFSSPAIKFLFFGNFRKIHLSLLVSIGTSRSFAILHDPEVQRKRMFAEDDGSLADENFSFADINRPIRLFLETEIAQFFSEFKLEFACLLRYSLPPG